MYDMSYGSKETPGHLIPFDTNKGSLFVEFVYSHV